MARPVPPMELQARKEIKAVLSAWNGNVRRELAVDSITKGLSVQDKVP